MSDLIFSAQVFLEATSMFADRTGKYMKTDDIVTWCENKYNISLTVVGSGAYAVVFQHPYDENKVIKISDTPDDDKWRYYIRYCIMHKEPWMPVVHEYDEAQHISIAVLEKLQPFVHSHSDVDADVFLEFFCPDKEEVYDDVYAHLGRWAERVACNCAPLATILGSVESTHHQLITEYTQMWKYLTETIEGSFMCDIHDGNIMYRGDQIVITDPIF